MSSSGTVALARHPAEGGEAQQHTTAEATNRQQRTRDRDGADNQHHHRQAWSTVPYTEGPRLKKDRFCIQAHPERREPSLVFKHELIKPQTWLAKLNCAPGAPIHEGAVSGGACPLTRRRTANRHKRQGTVQSHTLHHAGWYNATNPLPVTCWTMALCNIDTNPTTRRAPECVNILRFELQVAYVL